MINDSHDRWHIRLLIFQCTKRIRSLSSKQDVNEIIQQQWLIHGSILNVSAAQADTPAELKRDVQRCVFVEGKSLFYQNQVAAGKKNKHGHTHTYIDLHICKRICLMSLNQHKLWIFIKAVKQCIIYHDINTPHWVAEVNYLSQLLHAKWCNTRERSTGTVIFFFLFYSQHYTFVVWVHVYSRGTHT